MLKNTEAMGAIEADQIEARRFRTLGGVHEPTAQIFDICLVHGACLDGIIGEGADRQGRGC